MTKSKMKKLAAEIRAEKITAKGKIREWLKASGHKQAFADDVMAEAVRQSSVALSRHEEQRAPIGKRPWGPGGRLPKGTLPERLLARADGLIRSHLAWMRDAAVGAIITVKFGAPSLSVETYQDRDVYRGKFKGWAATGVVAKVTVPSNWYSTVHQQRLAMVDGMLTLSARHLERVDDVDLYAATWVERSRGYSARMVTGVIARAGAWQSYHAADAPAALRGLARKRFGSPARCPSLPEKKHGDVVVTLGDVRRVGACESGIRHWCHSTGLGDALDRGWATVRELAPAYKRVPARELRSAVMAAVRRTRA